MVSRTDAIEAEYSERCVPLGHLEAAIAEGQAFWTAQGTPTEQRFDYPVDKRQTRENIEQMRKAESNLDYFWRQVDFVNSRQLTSDDVQRLALPRLLIQPRTLQRTAPWVENQINQEAKSSAEDLTMPLSDVYLDLQQRTERTLGKQDSSGRVKSKVKTRGGQEASDGVLPSAETETQSRPSVDAQPTFPLGARALKVFKTIFYTPSRTATPGEVSWADFLHAMTSVGFLVQKLYGSVWQFTPSMLDVERNIHFHEPHPSGKIPFRVARRHGRRLQRTYGWHGSMFVAAQSE